MFMITHSMLHHVGFSEKSGPITTNLPQSDQWKLGIVGHPFVGMEVKLLHLHRQGERYWMNVEIEKRMYK